MRDVVLRQAVTRLRRLSRLWVSTWILWGAVVLLVGGLLASVPVSWQSLGARLWRTAMALGVAGLVAITGAVVLLAVATPRVVVRVRSRSRVVDRQVPVRPMPMWAIWLGLIVVVLVGGVAAWVLVSIFGSGSPQDKIRLEAIKLAGTIAVGTGGVAALLLTARRQRTTELDLLQRGHDADERRVTELYTAAAQQLASDKAPVRLAGLYALSRLGQTAPDHRQTIVNLFCAYLRMPDASFTGEDSDQTEEGADGSEQARQDGAVQPLLLDLAPTLAEAAGLSLDGAEQQQQERQVRLTAQRLLAQHLRPEVDENGKSANPDFWGGRDGEGLDLDLTNAALYEWDFVGCHVRRANFMDAHFFGSARFDWAQFHGRASFNGAHFYDSPKFDRAWFHRSAWFCEAWFHDRAVFDGAWFDTSAWFLNAHFFSTAGYDKVHFYGKAEFGGTRFDESALFNEVQFGSNAGFAAQLKRGARFDWAQFYGGGQFGGSQFHRPPSMGEVWVRLDHGSPSKSVWPPGYTESTENLGDGRTGQWAKLVPTQEEATDRGAPASSEVGVGDVHE